ncbi:hypothetical protein A2690_00890 [Candidatus Roizmanbacteria bacterium RIFCSPHIGHO2_01_FULL_39_12b]|uniref:Uncharacterized protein n=1 Tax=Candidatus Roizmanbacteria bacterium RIFCSPHIGHO2_01_FULL_39_12b TaxID=1802030 RepID=A0A1F7GAS9_9BACT|nr:MAG: hypothetical protein A2690_00890 [Candidatus Roizmanbacteria bacterium RIFCSPHIGHO2_01_FULL_39_12b]
MLARKVKSQNNQLYIVLSVFVIVGVFIWWLAQTLNAQRVTTGSEARVRNNSRFPTIVRQPTIPNTFTCNKKCDPVTDSGCPTGFVCVDVNSAKRDFPPNYRCVQYLICPTECTYDRYGCNICYEVYDPVSGCVAK